MALFGNKEKKAADQAAAAAEIERLRGLPVRELAAEILPAWDSGGVDSYSRSDGIGTMRVVSWLMGGNREGRKYLKPLVSRVGEAIQLLENSGLLLRTGRTDGGSDVVITSKGQAGLREGRVREYLA